MKDEDLDKLEESIHRLKNRYDQFFCGIAKVPPSQERKNVEVMIHELSRDKIRDNGKRFRFNTIVSRFNQYREMWGRKMREREEGPLDFKRRAAAMAAPSQDSPERPRPIASKPGDADRYVAFKPNTNGEAIRALYGELEREHQKLGKTPAVTLEQLQSMVQKQSELVRERYKVSTVGFRVETVDGKVKLKAKPLQDS